MHSLATPKLRNKKETSFSIFRMTGSEQAKSVAQAKSPVAIFVLMLLSLS
jgi:hypothetical protein